MEKDKACLPYPYSLPGVCLCHLLETGYCPRWSKTLLLVLYSNDLHPLTS